MGWLRRALGALTGEGGDKGHTGTLAPRASTQRTQLGLKSVDARAGVVVMRSGEARAFLRVAGYAVHHRSPEAARAWLQGYARVLNTLPGGAVMFVRTRPGGLEGHTVRQRTQTAALAKASPGSALARLSADQLAHARQLQASGETRRSECYVALWSPKGDAARVLAAAESRRRHLESVRVMAELVTDGELLDALVFAWHPGVANSATSATWNQDWNAADGRPAAVLSYWPGRAAVLDPPAPPPAAPPAPEPSTGRARVVEVNDQRRTGAGRVLPR